jgi:FkbM family methyltransferase
MFSSLKAKIPPPLREPTARLWRRIRNRAYVLPLAKRKTGGLIYDVGLCDGADTVFYLAKGFRVVAVEANPVLVASGKRRFEKDIKAGRLTIVQKAIAVEPGRASFGVHRVNPQLSSLVPSRLAGRSDDLETIEVECSTLADIIEEYGVPYYIKIDIEGWDLDAIKSLRFVNPLPRYVSAEAHSEQIVGVLHDLGYRRFKLVDQREKNQLNLWPWNWKEGRYVWTRFTLFQSGPFGEEAPGQWMTREEVIAALAKAEAGGALFKGHATWYDFHATF